MTSNQFVLFITLFLSACNSKTEIKSNKNEVDTTRKAAPVGRTKQNGHNSDKEDTILIDDNIFLLGDSSKHPEEAIDYIAVRFKPYIRFSDFQADTFNSKIKAAIKYYSNPTARHYKTVIADTYKKEGLNFGGHYCFVEWGCGSPCQQSALVDLNTGIVYDGVDAALGYDYKKDSRMLIVNPTDSTGFYLNCPYCEPEIFIWNDKTKKFEQR